MALNFNYSIEIESTVVLPTQITFSNVTFNGSVFGLQDALSNSADYYNGPPYDWPFIFSSSCPAKDGRPNCTAACLDPGIVFANLTNTHNCLIYPLISDLYAREQLSADTEIWASELGIEAYFLNSSSSNAILSTIQLCFWDYCESLEGCPDWVSQEYGDGGKGGISENFTDTIEIFNLQNEYWISAYANASGICSQISAPADPDIGGVGVHLLRMAVARIDTDFELGLLVLLNTVWHCSSRIFFNDVLGSRSPLCMLFSTLADFRHAV